MSRISYIIGERTDGADVDFVIDNGFGTITRVATTPGFFEEPGVLGDPAYQHRRKRAARKCAADLRRARKKQLDKPAHVT